MSDYFSEYINDADNELKAILCSPEVSEEEKKRCLSSFINSLYAESFRGESYTPAKEIISLESIKHIDEVFLEIMNKSRLVEEDVKAVKLLYPRQIANLSYAAEHGISIPSINYAQPDAFAEEIIRRYKIQSYREKIFDLNQRLSSSINECMSMQAEPTKDTYVLIDELEHQIEESRTEGIFFEGFDAEYIKKLRTDLDKYAIDLNDKRFLNEVEANDRKIGYSLKRLSQIDENEIDSLFPLLALLDTQLVDCERRGISTRSLANTDTEAIRSKLNKQKTDISNKRFLSGVKENDQRISLAINRLSSLTVEEIDAVYASLSGFDKQLAECESRRISTESLVNTDTKAIRTKLNHQKEEISNKDYFEGVKYNDKRISLMLERLSALTDAEISVMLSVLSVFDSQLVECKSRGIETSTLTNVDVNSIQKRIEDYKVSLIEREDVFERIDKCDAFIKRYDSSNDYRNTIDELISNCDELESMIQKCKVKNWSVKPLYCTKPSESRKKFSHYKEMITVDIELGALVSNKAYDNKRLYTLCDKQIENIRTCKTKRWRIPDLVVKEPEKIKVTGKAATIKKQKRKLILAGIALAVVIVIIIGVAVFVSIAKYNITHSKFPFSADSAVGKDCDDIVEELEDAGFTNIKTISDDGGILPSGAVISINMYGVINLKAGETYSNDAEIKIVYASDNRIDVTDALASYKKYDYDTTYDKLSSLGFNVSVSEVYSNSVAKNYSIESILLNNVQYDGGDCYIPKNAKVEINYYGKAIEIYDDSEDIVGDNYLDVYEELTDAGFVNIEFVKDDDLITGWITEDGSVSSITIADSEFDDEDEFYYQDEVLIHVHTFASETYDVIDD